ncbi:hypothetical protein Y1Q_0018304 [Alligator mississippiensis]|uniref:Uncharacterized protein n=1 Tax=Alligator mississippiensis TaxID=8496 RepID=A0A151PBP6_ALLMI|nr:hypothetical protein Y1Q_0018304 [Alligator mississippiensis]
MVKLLSSLGLPLRGHDGSSLSNQKVKGPTYIVRTKTGIPERLASGWGVWEAEPRETPQHTCEYPVLGSTWEENTTEPLPSFHLPTSHGRSMDENAKNQYNKKLSEFY